MTPEALLDDLRARGVQVAADGDRLRYRAPKGSLTPELRRALRDHKARLLPLVAAGVGVCRRCGQPAAPNLRYHCAACADALHTGRPSPREADPEGYARAVARLEAERDEKARWLREAERVLTGLDPDDPQRAR